MKKHYQLQYAYKKQQAFIVSSIVQMNMEKMD